jgi:hypothetical protein
VYIVHLGVDVGGRPQFAGFHFSPILMGDGDAAGKVFFNQDNTHQVAVDGLDQKVALTIWRREIRFISS